MNLKAKLEPKIPEIASSSHIGQLANSSDVVNFKEVSLTSIKELSLTSSVVLVDVKEVSLAPWLDLQVKPDELTQY